MANLTIDVDWQISNEGVTVIGNDANRFDAHRQSDTLGPYPPTESDGPDETNGAPGPSERAAK